MPGRSVEPLRVDRRRLTPYLLSRERARELCVDRMLDRLPAAPDTARVLSERLGLENSTDQPRPVQGSLI